MSRTEFIEQTVISLDETLFRKVKDILTDEYIPFVYFEKREINCMIFAEKLCDYFEKLELKNFKSFEQIVEKYAKDLDAVVCDRIAKEPTAKKNEPFPKVPRARKYYEKACSIKKNHLFTEQGLLDYSRIMLCLYMAIIDNYFNLIEDFDFSAGCLDLRSIIKALQMEKGFFGIAKFNIEDNYALDRGTFVVLMMMFYYIKSKEIAGEY